jgi:hypothetical protein
MGKARIIDGKALAAMLTDRIARRSGPDKDRLSGRALHIGDVRMSTT